MFYQQKKNKSDAESWETKLVERFLNDLLFEKGYSDNTIKAYKKDLIEWINFCRNKFGYALPPKRDFFFAYAKWLKDRGFSDASIERRISAIRTFLRYIIAERWILPDSPLPEIPKKASTLPKVLTEGEINRLILKTEEDKSVLGIRDKAIIELLYGLGLRASEIVNLDVLDVDFENKIVRCFGKGSKERCVPLNESACKSLIEYLKNARPVLISKKPDEKALFVSKNGFRLKREDIWRIIKKRGIGAGISKNRLYPHILRHSIATHLLRRGMDIPTLRELLGHESLLTTQKYTHLDVELKEVYKASHPRSMLSMLKSKKEREEE